MIDNILSAELTNKIVHVIKHQCAEFQRLTKDIQHTLYEPYTRSRQKSMLTSTVLSGFSPHRFTEECVEVQDVYYGLKRGLCQPELKTSSAVIQIYSDGATPQNSLFVKEMCQKFNREDHGVPHFLIIRFAANKNGYLSSIKAQYLGENCNIIEEKMLYKAANVKVLSKRKTA